MQASNGSRQQRPRDLKLPEQARPVMTQSGTRVLTQSGTRVLGGRRAPLDAQPDWWLEPKPPVYVHAKQKEEVIMPNSCMQMPRGCYRISHAVRVWYNCWIGLAGGAECLSLVRNLVHMIYTAGDLCIALTWQTAWEERFSTRKDVRLKCLEQSLESKRIRGSQAANVSSILPPPLILTEGNT